MAERRPRPERRREGIKSDRLAVVLPLLGPRAATPGVAANSGPSIDMSSVLRTMQRRRVESLVLGAFHHGQYTVLLCWYWGPT